MRMTWPSLLNEETAVKAGSPLASSTNLTDISALPYYTLRADFVADGTSFRFTAFGVFSTTSTPTLNLGVYWGGAAGTALATTGNVTTSSSVTNARWEIELITGFRTKGTSGTAMSHGKAYFGSSASALANAPVPMPAAALSTVTLDSTASAKLAIAAQWGTSSASNTITCHGFYIESLGL